MDAEKVKPLLRAVVQSNKGGVVAHRFNGEFRGIMGEDVPFRKLGFTSLNAFIETIPDTIRIGRGGDGELMYFAVADASTAHIQRMVAAQKSKKKVSRSKPSKGYLRKPAYKASWSKRSGPQMRPPQRPHVPMYRSTVSRPSQHVQAHVTHMTRSIAAHPSPAQQVTRSNIVHTYSAQHVQAQCVRGNLAGPRTSQNTQMLPTHSNLAGPCSSQNWQPQAAHNSFVSQQSQNFWPQPAKSFELSWQTGSNMALHSLQRKNISEKTLYTTQRHTSYDTAANLTLKTQQEVMCNYAAPHPQQAMTRPVESQHLSAALPEMSRQIPLHPVQTNESSVPKRFVSSSVSRKTRFHIDRGKLSPTQDTGVCEDAVGRLQITITGQENVATKNVKYGKMYKIPPRLQQLEKQHNLENSDIRLIFNDYAPENDGNTLPFSKCVKTDDISLSSKDSFGSSRSPVPSKPNINIKGFKKMLANYLQKHGSTARYETACVGTTKNPDRYVSSIEINGVIYGSLHVFHSADDAEDKAAQNACHELANCAKDDGETNKNKKGVAAKSTTTAVTSADSNMDMKVKERVNEIALKHVSGLWTVQLPDEYRATYWEEPPANLLSLIEEWTDIVKLELMAVSARKIMYPVTEPKSIKLVQNTKMDHYKVPIASVPMPGTAVTVLISHLVDCSHFYIQCADSTINEIMEELSEIYTGCGRPNTLLKPEPGLYCVAKYEDNNWYRARILAVRTTPDNEVVCDVMYIDFGNCDVVPASNILRIIESSCVEPAQAIRCSLHGVFPAEGDSWSEDAINVFFNLSMEAELKMDVIESDETSCSVVLRNMTDGNTNPSINRQMTLDGVVASMEPPPLELPENNDWPVLVMSVKMTTEVTIRLVGPDHSDKLEDLEDSLASLADVALSNLEPHVDGVYAACTTDGDGTSWGRVRVINIKGNECDVIFVDHGDTDVVNCDALRPLSRELNQLPYQALLCKLTGLEAYEKDQKVIDCLVEIALGKTCIAAVDDRLDKVSLTLWDTSSSEDVNINETAAKVLNTEDLTPKLPVCGGTIEVYVSCVTQQGEIYIQCQGPGLQQLEHVTEYIEEQYGKAGSASAFISSPQVSQLCIAKNLDSGSWYRAEVMKILPNRMVEVRFVDHGIVDIIHYRYLRDLPEGSSLRDLPYQAIRCQLYGLPPEGSDWTTAVLDRLTELMPPDKLRVLEVVVAPDESEDEHQLAQVEVYKISKDGELMAVSESVTQEEDLWADSEVFEDASSEPYVNPRVGEMNSDTDLLQPDTPTSVLTEFGGISIATH